MTDRPKAVLPVAGWPLLRYSLERARALDPARIVFLTGYRAAEVESVFGPAGPDRIFLAESSPLGTAGALASARAVAGARNWVANADSFVDVDAPAVLAAHKPGTATIVAVSVGADRSDYGGLEIRADGTVERFFEKGASGAGWINAGVYVLDRSMIEEIDERPGSLEQEVLPRWAREGRLHAFRSSAYFLDIGTPDRLARAEREFAEIRRRLEQDAAASSASADD